MNKLPEKYVVRLQDVPHKEKEMFIKWYNSLYGTNFNGRSSHYMVPYDKKGSTGIRALRVVIGDPSIPVYSLRDWKTLRNHVIEHYEIF